MKIISLIDNVDQPLAKILSKKVNHLEERHDIFQCKCLPLKDK